MDMKNKIDLNKTSQIALTIGGIVLIVAILFRFSSFLRPLSIGILLTYLFTPMLRMQGRDRYKAVLKVVGSLFIFVLVVSSIVYLTFTEVNALRNDNAIEEIKQASFLDQTISVAGQEIILSETLDVKALQDMVRSSVSAILNSFFAFISELLLIFVFLIFLIPLINKSINDSRRQNIGFFKFSKEMELGIRSYLKTKLLISLGTAATSYVVLLLFGIRLAMAFALIIFLFNFIPTFGDYISYTIILGTQLFVMGFGLKLFGLFLCLMVVQMVFGNYIEPMFSGKSLDLPPILIVLSLLFWGAIWGIGGMLFAVPLTVSVRTIFNHTQKYFS